MRRPLGISLPTSAMLLASAPDVMASEAKRAAASVGAVLRSPVRELLIERPPISGGVDECYEEAGGQMSAKLGLFAAMPAVRRGAVASPGA
jgi:hypothetical protein